MPVSDPDVSRPRLIRDASFLEADRREIALRRGRISAREVYDQVNACSCLTLILACIVYWQAREISRIAAAPDFPFDPDLLRHVSPIEWKNVILYGEIKCQRQIEMSYSLPSRNVRLGRGGWRGRGEALAGWA